MPCAPTMWSLAKVSVHRLPGGKVTWQGSPSHTLDQDIENGVENLPHIDFTFAERLPE